VLTHIPDGQLTSLTFVLEYPEMCFPEGWTCFLTESKCQEHFCPDGKAFLRVRPERQGSSHIPDGRGLWRAFLTVGQTGMVLSVAPVRRQENSSGILFPVGHRQEWPSFLTPYYRRLVPDGGRQEYVLLTVFQLFLTEIGRQEYCMLTISKHSRMQWKILRYISSLFALEISSKVFLRIPHIK
jgi:hypothetical protein